MWTSEMLQAEAVAKVELSVMLNLKPSHLKGSYFCPQDEAKEEGRFTKWQLAEGTDHWSEHLPAVCEGLKRWDGFIIWLISGKYVDFLLSEMKFHSIWHLQMVKAPKLPLRSTFYNFHNDGHNFKRLIIQMSVHLYLEDVNKSCWALIGHP